MMDITLSPELEGKLRFAAFTATGVKIVKEAPELWEEIEAFSEACRRKFEGRTPGQIEPVQPARELYRACGVDPTRRRPASEALLRRILKGKPLYRINNAVDCCNYCSLHSSLPIGMYDPAFFEGETITIRLGAEGEGYKGLGKDRVNLGGHILLADGAGPFGHPSGDSFRTRVRDETTALLWILFAPLSFDPSALRTHLEFSMDWIVKCAGGEARVLEP
jgi:DNA/RNA-binding domain of Phe-tRNA-synthetase-like protein